MKTKTPKRNVELLQKVQKHILAEPRRLDMAEWINEKVSRKLVPCGTTACIAGWVLKLSHTKPGAGSGGYYSGPACEVLGITELDGAKLFYDDNWPQPYRSQLDKATSQQDLAKIAARRIGYFIKHNK